MVTFRYSNTKDLPDIALLMQKSFGDTHEYIQAFFHYFYRDNVLVAVDDKEIVSMAFLLPAFLEVKKQRIPATYLYACATREGYRGKGLMADLIEEACRDVCRRGEAGVFLLPATVSLYDYYMKLGFREFFYENREKYIPEDQPENDGNDVFEIFRISGEIYQDQRSLWLTSDFAVHYPLAHFQFVEQEFQGDSGGLYQISKQNNHVGIAFIRKKGDILEVKELLVNPENLVPLSRFLIRRFDCHNIEISRPGYTERTALLKCNKHYEYLYREKGYFNFALD